MRCRHPRTPHEYRRGRLLLLRAGHVKRRPSLCARAVRERFHPVVRHVYEAVEVILMMGCNCLGCGRLSSRRPQNQHRQAYIE